MKKVVELYNGILPAFGLTVDETSKIFIGGGELDKQAALQIDGKNIYLPTEEFLKDSTYRDQIAFHPLIENVLKTPSQMLHILQQALTTRMYITGTFIIQALLGACAKQKKGEEISSPKLLKYVSGNESADEKTLQFFKDLMRMMEQDKSKKLFSVYLKFGGKLDGEEVSRMCSIASPLLDALERSHALGSAKSGPASVWGVEAPRKKDVELLINVIKSAFPRLEEKGYTKGTVNKIAPYCACLFESTLALNEDVLEITKALAKQEPVSSLIAYLLVDLNPLMEMLATVDEWDIYRNTIMKTAYNEGEKWNSEASKGGSAAVPDYQVVKESADTPATQQVATQPAITKTIIANQVKRVPGSRQPLVTLPEEEQGPLSRTRPSRYDDERDERRGFERGNYHGKQSRFEDREERSGGRGYDRGRRVDPRDMTLRELEDRERDLKADIIDIERHGNSTERAEIRYLEDDLLDIRKEIDYRTRDDRDRDDRGRGRSYDDRRPASRESNRRYGNQGSNRPVPRVMENQRRGRGREDDRGGRRRFEDRY